MCREVADSDGAIVDCSLESKAVEGLVEGSMDMEGGGVLLLSQHVYAAALNLSIT